METRTVKILVVDDYPANLTYLSKLLTKRGYEVELAMSGNLALKKARTSLPDLILLDIMMPDLNGYEVCQQLKSHKRTQHIPIIFVSVISDTQDQVKAFKLGAVDYVTKPFHQEEIIARIQNHLKINPINKAFFKLKNIDKNNKTTPLPSIEKFVKAFQNSSYPISLTTWDEERYIEVNLSFLKVFELAPSEILEKTVDDLNLWVDPKDKKSLKNKLQQTGDLQNLEVKLRTKSGTLKTFLLWQSRIEIEGECYILSIFNEADQRIPDFGKSKLLRNHLQESENKYRDLVETSQDIIWSVNTQGQYTFINQAAKQILGYEPEEMIGRHFYEFIPSVKRNRTQTIFGSVFKGKSLVHYEHLSLTKAGKVIYLLINAIPVRDDQGQIIGITGTASDITKKKQQEQALKLIVEGTASKTGQEFFQSCVYYLAQVLNVGYTFVSKSLNAQSTRLRTLAFWNENKWLDNFEYELSNSPSEIAISGATCYYPEIVQSTFASVLNYKSLKIKGCWTIPLVDCTNKIIGHLNIMDTQPIKLDASKESILKIFAARAGAELERQLAEELLHHHSALEHLLSQISRTFINENLETGIHFALSEIGQFLNSNLTFLFQGCKNNTEWLITHLWCQVKNHKSLETTPLFSLSTHPWICQHLQQQSAEILYIPNLACLPLEAALDRESLAEKGCYSLLIVPLMKAGKAQGFMGLVTCRQSQSWSAEEINWLRLIAELIAMSQASHETQQALAHSNTRYQNLAENVPGMIYQLKLHPDGRITFPFVSSGCRELFGLEPERVQENSQFILERIHASDRLEFYQSLHCCARTLSPWSSTWRITLGEQIKWLQSNSRPEKQADDSILWDGVIVDITIRKQAEETLKENAARQSALTKIIERMRQSLDLESIFSATTQELRYALKVDRVAIYQFNSDWSGEFVAESVASGWVSLVQNQSEEQNFATRTLDEESCSVNTIETEIEPIIDTYLQDTQGGLYTEGISYLCTPDIYQAGFTDCYIKLLERFQARSYITVPIFCNQISAESSALQNANSPSSNSFSLPSLPAYPTLKLWGLLAVYQNAHPRQWQNVEIDMVVQVGNQLGVALQQAQLFVHTRQQSEALKQSAYAADAANRAKSEFLANMSHELRTPLNAILGFTQMMNRDPSLSLEQQKNLNIINRSGEHLLALINDILEMSKIEAGRITFNPNYFDLFRVLKSLEEMLQLKAQSKGLQLLIEKPLNVPQLRIKTDESKLRQVLINLLGNAIKFTESGWVKLRVKTQLQLKAQSSPELMPEFPCHPESAHRSDRPEIEPATADLKDNLVKVETTEIADLCGDAPVFLRFEVEDTGPGIASDELDQIFEAFTQTTAGAQVPEGTGLGLPISQKFVQLMGGEITVESVLGQGAKFAFEIPVTLESCDIIPATKPTQKTLRLAPLQSIPRILIIEDHPTNRLLLINLLGNMGFEVREAENGLEGLGIWQAWQPHLILMDIRMPVMDGYVTTKTIRKKAQQLPKILNQPVIIALTATAFEKDRKLALSVGCDDFLRKPFQDEELLEKIGQYLNVQYIYESQSGCVCESVAEDAPVDASALQVMPQAWIEALGHGAAQCSDRLLFSLIEQIPPEHEMLAQTLAQWVENFRFDLIMALTHPPEDGATNIR